MQRTTNPCVRIGLFLIGLALTACQTSSTKPIIVDGYYNLGGLHHDVDTTSVEAQEWFDRGLALCYAFNHEEAIRCFERAVAADPNCAMAHWGIAYALGPNINNSVMDEDACRRAFGAVHAAAAAGATGVDGDLIAALETRYSWPAPDDRSDLDLAYANAMRGVHARHPSNVDVTALCAESVMMLRPWKHWSPDGTPAPETAEIVAILEGGLAIEPSHPALCHFYIHTMEASPKPARALAAANRLRDRMPGAGHLIHMPSHIDVLVGDYDNVITANQRAIAADTVFVEREGRENFYTLYRIHNYHFLVYGAMFDGQSELALTTARSLVDEIPEPMLVEMPDFLDAFVPTPLHVMVRFGQWDAILVEPAPAAYLPMTRAIWHYARGLAYASTGDVAAAQREQAAFEVARAEVPETSMLFQNTSLDILGVAGKMLDGEIAYRRGDPDAAFADLEEAVRRDDALNYDEPWGWMQPARHALGALLLEQGRVAQAEAVYRSDLRRHPNNPWALHGLAESLARQGDVDEATATTRAFAAAAVRTDVDISASCYCRLETMAGVGEGAGR